MNINGKIKELVWTEFGVGSYVCRVFDEPTPMVYAVVRYYSEDPFYSVRVNGNEIAPASDADAGKALAQSHFEKHVCSTFEYIWDENKSVDEIDDQMKNFMSGVVGIVEASSYESMMLWSENHKKYDWKEGRSGFLVTVGFIGTKPVCISVLTPVINGHKLLFWHATSTVVDYDMIRKWIELAAPETAYSHGHLNNTDAMNFHNVLHQADRMKEEAA